jgi:putative AlgH/UPF0301 family transcriptional regulator
MARRSDLSHDILVLIAHNEEGRLGVIFRENFQKLISEQVAALNASEALLK